MSRTMGEIQAELIGVDARMAIDAGAEAREAREWTDRLEELAEQHPWAGEAAAQEREWADSLEAYPLDDDYPRED